MKNKKTRQFTALFAIGLALPFNGALAQISPRSSAPVTKKIDSNALLLLDPAVRTGKLSNGFTYYIRHNEEPKHRVLMYLVNKAGSILEDEDQRGLAHFMEHMSFNGTTHFPHNQLEDYLQKAGVRFGADLNAYTSFDETVYELPIPSDKPELLAGGIKIMRDWAREATLDPDEINKERGVVLEEKRMNKGAQDRMQKVYFPVLLNNSRYAVRIPIGLDTIISNFKPETIKRFYKDWYRPDLQAIIVVGDIDVNQMEQIIKQQFSSLKNPVNERVRVKYTVPLTGKNQFISITDKEVTATVARVLIKHKQPQLRTASDYLQATIRGLFNNMLSERYAEFSRKPDPSFVQCSADISGFMGGLDSYEVMVVAKPGELKKGFNEVWRETERIKCFGFTATELERAKAMYLSHIEAGLMEKDKTNSAGYVTEYKEYFLNGEAAPGITAEYQLTKKYLPAITLSDVNNLSKEYITNTNRDIIITAPEKDKGSLPDEKMVGEWLKAVSEENLLPYKDEVSTLPLLTAQPVAGKVISDVTDKVLNINTLTLSNGIKVILKPTIFKNDEILFTAFAAGGTSLYSDADFQSAANAGVIIPANGVGNYNPDQLYKYLKGKLLQVKPFIGEQYQGINGGSTVKDLETALQMVYAYFTEPIKDTVIFNGVIQKAKANLQNRSNDPNSVFSDTVSAVLGNNNYRRTAPTIAKVNQIDLGRAYSIYKERFADASNFTFTFVGSFDSNTIKPLLEKYLGALPGTNKHEEAKDLHIQIPEGKIEKSVYKGTEPKASVLLVYSGKFDYNPESNVCLNALKETLQISLLQRLREKESGVYTPGVYMNTGKYPEARYSMIIKFSCAPQNVDKLIASANDEVNKLRTIGPTEENVAKWRAEEKTTTETQLKTNGFWLTYINSQLQNKENLDQVNSYNTLLDKITTTGLKNIAAKYLDGNNYIRLVLMPEKEIAGK